ncbi:MAG TPA: response regulator [Candidatus Aquicultor sp.]
MSICLGEVHHTKVDMIKALVVDDDVVYQNLLCRLLGSRGIQVVGRASGMDQAALLYRATDPDVVLVGLSSVNRDSLSVLAKIREVDASAKVIVLSIFNSFDEVEKGEGELADAYLLKGSSAKDIVSTIRDVVIDNEE